MTIVLALSFSLLITMLPFVAFVVLAITDQDDKVGSKNYLRNKFVDSSKYRRK